MKKKCSKCKIRKSLSAFHAHKNRRQGVHNQCKSCRRNYYTKPEVKAASLVIQRKNYCPEINRKRNLFYKFGITAEKYDKLLIRQKGVCAICGCKFTDKKGRRLAVDHCHKTKRVRGLLCSNCNNGLGRFKDNPTLLAKAIAYLKR